MKITITFIVLRRRFLWQLRNFRHVWIFFLFIRCIVRKSTINFLVYTMQLCVIIFNVYLKTTLFYAHCTDTDSDRSEHEQKKKSQLIKWKQRTNAYATTKKTHNCPAAVASSVDSPAIIWYDIFAIYFLLRSTFSISLAYKYLISCHLLHALLNCLI